MRTSIYIDGFNLYYRALKGTPYKWLDVKQLAINLLQPQNVITEIKYFTASVSGIFDPSQPIRQKTYIRALKSHIPEFSVYYGHFLSHPASPFNGQCCIHAMKSFHLFIPTPVGLVLDGRVIRNALTAWEPGMTNKGGGTFVKDLLLLKLPPVNRHGKGTRN